MIHVICVFLYRPAIIIALDGFSGPTDDTGQIDFSDGTACACPGSPVQYLCTVSDPSGQSATLWRGTAFDCIGNQALLLHSQYTSGSAADACNDGIFTLTARGLTNVTGNCYSSVLTVNIEPGLNGRTVECTSAGSRTIGNDTLQVAGRVEGESDVCIALTECGCLPLQCHCLLPQLLKWWSQSLTSPLLYPGLPPLLSVAMLSPTHISPVWVARVESALITWLVNPL